MAADRGAYIDQSQSFNVFMPDPNFGKLTSLHFYAWKKGLKTGMYYLRTRAAADAIKFTVDTSALKAKKSNPSAQSVTKAAASTPDMTPTANTKPSINSFQSNMDREAELAKMVCSLENKDACLMCGS